MPGSDRRLDGGARPATARTGAVAPDLGMVVVPSKADEDPDPARPVEDLIRLTGPGSTPIYVQLADQLRYLIRTGDLPIGSRLPTARHLAQNLRINRNTVMSAYSSLAREGYVRGNRRGGTTVISARLPDVPESAPARDRLRSIVDELITAASRLGMAPGDMGALVEGEARSRLGHDALGVCFVECNQASLSYFVKELESEFGIRVVPALLSELTIPGAVDLDALDCVISTFYHLSEVRLALHSLGVSKELFAIAVRPHLSVVDALESLPPGSSVGVAYVSTEGDRAAMEQRLARMTDAVEQTKVRGLRVLPILLSGKPSPRQFQGLDALLVRPENIGTARDMIPRNVRVIEFINVLDSSAKHFLREVFADLATRPRHGVADDARSRGGWNAVT